MNGSPGIDLVACKRYFRPLLIVILILFTAHQCSGRNAINAGQVLIYWYACVTIWLATMTKTGGLYRILSRASGMTAIGIIPVLLFLHYFNSTPATIRANTHLLNTWEEFLLWLNSALAPVASMSPLIFSILIIGMTAVSYYLGDTSLQKGFISLKRSADGIAFFVIIASSFTFFSSIPYRDWDSNIQKRYTVALRTQWEHVANRLIVRNIKQNAGVSDTDVQQGLAWIERSMDRLNLSNPDQSARQKTINAIKHRIELERHSNTNIWLTFYDYMEVFNLELESLEQGFSRIDRKDIHDSVIKQLAKPLSPRKSWTRTDLEAIRDALGIPATASGLDSLRQYLVDDNPVDDAVPVTLEQLRMKEIEVDKDQRRIDAIRAGAVEFIAAQVTGLTNVGDVSGNSLTDAFLDSLISDAASHLAAALTELLPFEALRYITPIKLTEKLESVSSRAFVIPADKLKSILFPRTLLNAFSDKEGWYSQAREDIKNREKELAPDKPDHPKSRII